MVKVLYFCETMNRLKQPIFVHITVLFVLIILVSACKSTKNVPTGRHLLVSNKIFVTGDKVNTDEIEEVIKQQPNSKFLGLRMKLGFYNSIDSAKLVKHKELKYQRLIKKNKRKIKREIRINTKKRNKAIRKGQSDYIYKKIKLKDTINPNLTWREKVKFKLGEAPVIADSSLLNRSVKQVHSYFKSKGYFSATAYGDFDTIFKRKKDKRKVIAHYHATTGERTIVDSISYSCDNPGIQNDFLRFIRKESDKNDLNSYFKAALIDKKAVNMPFDAEKLDAYRDELAEYMRDQSYFGFQSNQISYKADTTLRPKKMSLTFVFGDRAIQSKEKGDSVYYVKHVSTKVNQVYFHFCDTSNYPGNFREDMKKLDLELKQNNFLITRDTFLYKELKRPVENYAASNETGKKVIYKSQVNKKINGEFKDSIDFDPHRMATFYYNGGLFVSPKLVETQNYLENENYYKEYYLERSFDRLVQLNLFAVIKPEIIETYPGSGIVEVHYYLVPAVRQSFSFEPRAKNSNGFLGLTASLNYNNKNIFRSGTNFTFSISGGFESNPSVFSTNDKGKKIKTQGRSFNTFEFGPSLKLDIPGLFPFGVTILGKRQRPRTEISAAYNYQHRPDFDRGVFQFNYLYKFLVGDGKTQTVSFGFPGFSVIKYVSLTPRKDFEAKINQLNDLFLKNAYRDQFIWEDFKMTFDYDNKEARNRKSKKIRFLYGANFSIAGNLVNAMTNVNPKYDDQGHKTLFGVPFSQFTVLDNKAIVYYEVAKNQTLAFRAMAGVGFPMKNSPTSLPYDYSFFGGGANDNRGWAARTLGPGSYQGYLDPNQVLTQIGDIRFNSSLEYRIGTGGLFNHALFVDAGNIWTMKSDPNRVGGQFSARFLKELAVSVGYGLRLDFSYFIFRLDLGVPIHNPGLPEGERWIFTPKTKFYQQAEQIFGTDYKSHIPLLYIPRINFGIGLPF